MFLVDTGLAITSVMSISKEKTKLTQQNIMFHLEIHKLLITKVSFGNI